MFSKSFGFYSHRRSLRKVFCLWLCPTSQWWRLVSSTQTESFQVKIKQNNWWLSPISGHLKTNFFFPSLSVSSDCYIAVTYKWKKGGLLTSHASQNDDIFLPMEPIQYQAYKALSTYFSSPSNLYFLIVLFSLFSVICHTNIFVLVYSVLLCVRLRGYLYWNRISEQCHINSMKRRELSITEIDFLDAHFSNWFLLRNEFSSEKMLHLFQEWITLAHYNPWFLCAYI